MRKREREKEGGRELWTGPRLTFCCQFLLGMCDSNHVQSCFVGIKLEPSTMEQAPYLSLSFSLFLYLCLSLFPLFVCA